VIRFFPPTELIRIAPEKEPPPPPEAQPETPRTQDPVIARVDPIVTPPLPQPDFVNTAEKPVIVPPLPPLPQPEANPPTATPEPVTVDASFDRRFADALQPPYPPAMQRIGTEGRAVVRVLIGVDGRVKAVEPVEATDAAFHEATERQALRRWRFKPATRDGQPVESWKTMAVRFVIE